MRSIPLASLALALACAASAATFDCGPMLLEPTPESISIMVHHESPVSATLSWRLEGESTRHTLVRSASMHHLFALSDLQPDEMYAYRITGDGKLDTGDRRFHTPPQDASRYTLVAFGDLRSQPRQWRRVAEAVRTREPDALAIITTGDFPSDGQDYTQWVQQFFEPGRALLATIPLIPCIGNHERTERRGGGRDPRSHYFELFQSAIPRNAQRYRLDYGLHTLLVLDSNAEMKKGSAQYRWLEEQLCSSRRRWTMLAFHHGVYTSGPHGRVFDDTHRPVETPIRVAREQWRPLFEKYGVDLVLNGHDHLYERSENKGVQYVVTGGAGAPLYEPDTVENPFQVKVEKAHHYCRIEVSPERLVVSAIRPDGGVIERFTIEKD